MNVIEPSSVEISPEEVTVFEGSEEEVTAIVRSSAGDVLSGRSVEWSIDDPEVAVVSAMGVVRGERQGSTTVRVQADGIEASAPVTVLLPPEIGLSRSEIVFRQIAGEGNPPAEEVAVVNNGQGSLTDLSLTVETTGDHAGWLSASLESSEAPTTLTLSASAGDRPVGRYEGVVLVRSSAAQNTPQVVQVTLEVEAPPPVISVDPASISFSSIERSFTPAPGEVLVTNAGGRILTGLSAEVRYLVGPSGWLSADFGSSTTAPTVLELEASARELTAGTYLAEIIVSSALLSVESQTIEVEFLVSAGRGVPGP